MVLFKKYKKKNHIISMIVIGSLLLVLTVVLFFKFYYQPKRTLAWYKDVLEGLGYKVKAYDYKLLGAPYHREVRAKAL